jgi:Nucleotidyltransferase domain
VLPPPARETIAAFADHLRDLAIGLYAGGSLATGDFHPGISDFDLAAVVATPPDEGRLVALHERMLREHFLAAKLHCVYVPLPAIADPATEHPTWAHGELYRRPLSGIARAELLTFGITVFGPPPATLLPATSPEALRAAVRTELSGYWRGALDKPHLWLEDLYVDLGLLVLVRAGATLTEGRLITKREAITRLPDWGVPAGLVHEIESRRAGRAVPVADDERIRRAELVRKLVADGIRQLLET